MRGSLNEFLVGEGAEKLRLTFVHPCLSFFSTETHPPTYPGKQSPGHTESHGGGMETARLVSMGQKQINKDIGK